MARATAIAGCVLRRERLFALLDGAAGKATWISGPPGSGKTTLVSSWVEARRVPCLWYRVRPGDADLASFFHELGARALQRRIPLPAFTPQYRGGEATFARAFFRDLVSRRRPPWALVLDDLELVASPQPLLAILREAIEELPPGVRAILVSRDEPPAALARLIANGTMSVVGGEQLRLTDAEALAIARSHAPGRTPEELEGMCRRAAGWAAGLVLLATSPVDGARGPREPPALFPYLASELLDRADPEVRRILVAAAVPPTLPARVVPALCGSERALDVLQDLARRAYFVALRGREDPVFELHPLAREFLLDRGRTALSQDQLRSVECRAAVLLAEAGYEEDAIDLYSRAEAWADVARMALAQAPRLVATGRTARLEAWLEALPPALAGKQPWLSYWRGACRAPVDPAAARRHLLRAWEGFDEAGDVTGLHLAFAMAIDSFLWQWGDLHGMGEWIDRFEAVAGRHPMLAEGEVALRSEAAMFTALTFHRLESEALPRWEERSLEVVHDVSLPTEARLAMGANLVVECAFRGEGTRAASVVRTLAPLARTGGVNLAAALGWLSAEAVHFWHAGAPSESDGTASLGLEMARESGVHVWDFHLRQQRVLAALAAGDPGRAREHMAALEASLAVRRPLHRVSLLEMESLVAIHEGDAPGAVSAARAMSAAARDTGLGFGDLLASLHLSLALVEAGDAGARAQLEASRHAGVAARSAIAEMIVEVAQAELERRSGDVAAARDRLSRGLGVSREKGIAPDIWFSRGRLAVLCALALDSDVETEHVVALVRRLDLAAPPGCGSERWPWKVHVRLLGPLEVAVRGAPLRFSSARRRSLDVLPALVARGDRAPGPAVAAALWPESEGDLAHHALETATYRLRRLLGADIVRHREGELRLDTGRCWVDALAFEALLAGAAACLQRRDPRGALAAADGALTLYRGPFLPGRAEPWALAARERLRVHLRRCLSDLERLGSDREDVRRLWARAGAADREVGDPSRQVWPAR